MVSLDHPHGILAKEELARIPLLSRWMRLLGCVYVERDDVRGSLQALKDASAVVKGGDSFTIFPRAPLQGEEGGVGEFKAGAFRIAIKSGVPVVPVAISGARGLYESHNYIVHPGTVRVTILPAIRTAGHEQGRAAPAARGRPPEHPGRPQPPGPYRHLRSATMASYRYERNITEEDVRPVKEHTLYPQRALNNCGTITSSG